MSVVVDYVGQLVPMCCEFRHDQLDIIMELLGCGWDLIFYLIHDRLFLDTLMILKSVPTIEY